MPVLNLGTGSGQHGDVANATALWIGVGGVGIDTALHYEDEAAIAAGIAAAKADPASLFITSKIPCATYATATADIKSNLKQLGVDKVSPIWKEGALRGVLPSPSRLLAFACACSGRAVAANVEKVHIDVREELAGFKRVSRIETSVTDHVAAGRTLRGRRGLPRLPGQDNEMRARTGEDGGGRVLSGVFVLALPCLALPRLASISMRPLTTNASTSFIALHPSLVASPAVL